MTFLEQLWNSLGVPEGLRIPPRTHESHKQLVMFHPPTVSYYELLAVMNQSWSSVLTAVTEIESRTSQHMQKQLEYSREIDPDHVSPLQSYDEGYWRQCLQYRNEQFKRHFRITKDLFWMLHYQLFGVVDESGYNSDFYHTHFRLGLFLYRMATKMGVREIAELFSVSKSTVCRITREIGVLICEKLSDKYIKFPHSSCFDEISSEWFAKTGFPHVIGAIDGSHVNFANAPHEQGYVYFDRKKNYSLNVQAVVNFRGIFMDVDIGWPGSVHDARVFQLSRFYEKMSKTVTELKTSYSSGCWFILGDAAYPLSTWLMKPYPIQASICHSAKRSFNITHAKARVVVEHAFGRLKQRWRRLYSMDCKKVATAAMWVHACVILHNFCELKGDFLEPEQIERVNVILDRERKEEDEQEDAEGLLVEIEPPTERYTPTANDTRNALAEMFYQGWLTEGSRSARREAGRRAVSAQL